MSKACKVCGGLIFASSEVVSYSGPVCNNPFHLTTYILPFNDNTSLLERIINLENEVLKLKSASQRGEAAPSKEVKHD